MPATSTRSDAPPHFEQSVFNVENGFFTALSRSRPTRPLRLATVGKHDGRYR